MSVWRKAKVRDNVTRARASSQIVKSPSLLEITWRSASCEGQKTHRTAPHSVTTYDSQCNPFQPSVWAELYCCSVFKAPGVRISDRTRAIPTAVLRGFYSVPLRKCMVVRQIRRDGVLPHLYTSPFTNECITRRHRVLQGKCRYSDSSINHSTRTQNTFISSFLPNTIFHSKIVP